MIQLRMLSSAVTYDEQIKAHIFPWADHLQTFVGLVYVFDHPSQPNRLIYLAPKAGTHLIGVHVISKDIEMVDDNGTMIVKIPNGGRPDPEADTFVTDIDLALNG